MIVLVKAGFSYTELLDMPGETLVNIAETYLDLMGKTPEKDDGQKVSRVKKGPRK